MRDFAKLKILEVSTISWQYFGWSLVYLQCCEFLVLVSFFFFFFFFFFGVLWGLMSAIGPEMTGVGRYTFTFNVKYSFNSKICKCLILVYHGARCVHICEIYAVKHVHDVLEKITYLVVSLQMLRISRYLLVRKAQYLRHSLYISGVLSIDS